MFLIRLRAALPTFVSALVVAAFIALACSWMPGGIGVIVGTAGGICALKALGAVP